jgi:hypothetical protein
VENIRCPIFNQEKMVKPARTFPVQLSEAVGGKG